MTLYSWGNPRYFPRLPAPVAPLLRRRRTTRASLARLPLAAASLGASDAHRPARPERIERRALHARHRRESVRPRHERRPPQSAQLRRHRASVGRAVSFRADRTTPRMSIDELTTVDGLPAIAVAGYSLGGNLALKLAGRVRRRAAARATRRRRRIADHRDRRVRAARSSGRAMSSISGTS